MGRCGAPPARKGYHDKGNKSVCHGTLFVSKSRSTMRLRECRDSHGTILDEVNLITMKEAQIEISHGIK